MLNMPTDLPKGKPGKTVEVLVLCIDRDDDLGKKAGVKGPVIGEEDNFMAAKALAMADPEDDDLNAIFAAIKLKRESEHLYKGVEVVTITGDKEVGVKSDQKLNNQLGKVLEMYKPKGVILVSDGAEDNQVIPLIESETKILSIRTVTVKLSRPLESAYFKIQDFFGKIGENPRQARLLFGLPGVLILMIVLLEHLGIPIVQVILAMLGVYLIAKGFGYDEQLFSGLSEVKNSLLQGRVYRVFNVLALLVIVLSLITGYLQLQKNLDAIYRPGSLASPTSVSEALISQPALALNFLLFSSAGTAFAAIDLLLTAVFLMCTGFIIHNFLLRNYLRIKRYLYIVMIAILVKYLAPAIYWSVISLQSESTTITVEGFDPIQNLSISLLISSVALLVVHYLLKIVFFDYITRKKQLEGKYLGMEVVSKKGKKLGAVTKVAMRGAELEGVYIRRRFYPMDKGQVEGNVFTVSE